MSAVQGGRTDTFAFKSLVSALPQQPRKNESSHELIRPRFGLQKSTQDAHPSSMNKNPLLLRLPTEVLCHITNYLAPAEAIGKDDGYGLIRDLENHSIDIRPMHASVLSQAAEARKGHAAGIQALLSLALTCKRLTPVAYDILYHKPALPQPVGLRNGHVVSALPRFLRTIIERPDLGALVRHLSVWLWMANPVRQLHGSDKKTCACHGCTEKVRSIIDTLCLRTSEKSKWLATLASPTEAMVCSLVLASLPKLQSLELYARLLPSPWTPELCVRSIGDIGRNPLVKGETSEVLMLSRGLALTRIHTLTLSTELNGLHRAGLPTLTTLTLDYSKRNPLVMVAKGSFVNVTTLKIQGSATYPTEQDRPFVYNGLKFRVLLLKLPQLRVLEFQSGFPARIYTVPPNIEKIIIRAADLNALGWAKIVEKSRIASSALRHIELHWRRDGGAPSGLFDIEGSAREIKLDEVVVWKGSRWGVLKALERV